MFTLPDLLQGTPPTFDAQAVRDSTDDAILAAGMLGYGANNGSATPPVLGPPTTTPTCTNTTTTAISTLVGGQNLAVSAMTSTPGFLSNGGYFYAPTSGGGVGLFGYASSTSTVVQNVTWISGGSGNINSGATLTAFGMVGITNFSGTTSLASLWVGTAPSAPGYVFAGQAFVSIQAPGAAAGVYTSLPASATDRKDMLVCSPSGALSLVQGTACGTLDWTKQNVSYATPPPVKPPWSSSTPIVLAEVYIPGTNSTHWSSSTGQQLLAGNIVDKSVLIGLNLASPTGTGETAASSDTTIVNATTDYNPVTTASLPTGVYEVTVNCQFTNTSGSAVKASARIVAGSASISGGIAPGEDTIPATSNLKVSHTGTLTVTAAGTIKMAVRASAGSSAVVAKQNTPTDGYAGATSLTVVRIG